MDADKKGSMFELKEVTFSYNGRKVIDSLSLKINAGEMVGLIGPNGAGKSTLLRLLSKILSPEKGAVYFQNRRMDHISTKELAREMAVLPSETFIAYDFSVLEIVKMGRAPHLSFWSEGDERDLSIVQSALQAVGIEHLAERNIHSLSSGERQMAFLAQALAQEPRAILLDEPTVHLDLPHQLAIFSLLKKWNQEKELTIVLVSHDLNLASQFCGRIVLLHGGKIIKDGVPEEVVTKENLKEVYGVELTVMANPHSGLPTLFFTSL